MTLLLSHQMFLYYVFPQELFLSNLLTVRANEHGFRERCFTVIQQMFFERLLVFVRNTTVWAFILSRLVRTCVGQFVYIIEEI